jgi:hypothetical protein
MAIGLRARICRLGVRAELRADGNGEEGDLCLHDLTQILVIRPNTIR